MDFELVEGHWYVDKETGGLVRFLFTAEMPGNNAQYIVYQKAGTRMIDDMRVWKSNHTTPLRYGSNLGE